MLSRITICFIYASALVLIPSVAAAQAAVLDEILVTATKREQGSQDIPLSIAIVSGESLSQRGIDDLFDLSKTVPNFDVAFNVTSNSVTMRGFSSGQERSFEQSVGMFIDGQYMPRSRQYRAPFMDVDRVEVVRGPQAVLFGLNSTAGAVSIVSNRTRPGDASSFDVIADYEVEYGGPGLTAVLGGSPTETLGLRLAVNYEDRDGYYENTTLGDEGDVEATSIRLSGVWEPTPQLSINAKFELSDYETRGNTGEIYGTVAQIVEGATNDGVLNWRRASDASFIDPFGQLERSTPGDFGELQNSLLQIDYDFGAHTVSFIGGHSKFDWDYLVDLDTSSTPILDAAIDEDYEQSSGEIRLASNDNEVFNFIVGAYFQTSNLLNLQPNIINGALFVPGFGPVFGTSIFELEDDLSSVFAYGTWQASDAIIVTGGLRQFSDDKDVRRNRRCGLLIDGVGFVSDPGTASLFGVCPNAASSDGFSGSRSSDDVMPEIAIQWDAADNIMLYAKYGQSTKAGGFASDTNVSLEGVQFGDEEASGIEAGMKARFANGAAELNLALFSMDFEDLQVKTTSLVNAPGGGIITTPVVTNAGEASSQGLEVDGRWAATEWLTLGGSVAFLDAEYDNFVTSTCNSVKIPDPVTGNCTYSGDSLPFAADYSGTIYGDVVTPINGNINFVAGLTVSFRDKYFTDPSLEPEAEIDSWARIDARIGLAAADDRWSVAVVGKNLGEEEIYSSQPLLGYIIGYVEPPRQVFVQGRYSFGW